MGHVCWPTCLAVLSDSHAYFIISLSYDFLKALSSGMKLVPVELARTSTSSMNGMSDVFIKLTEARKSASAKI